MNITLTRIWKSASGGGFKNNYNMMASIKRFIEIGKNDAAVAGGKGASLGEMTQAGLPVPPGFVVVADAFDRFISEASLKEKIDALLSAVDINESSSVESASESIRQLISAAPMSEELQDEIMTGFGNLGAELVAVRSSATAEDSSAASWAGELETYLNVTADNLIESVKLCWSSLFTPRAIFYRIEKGLADHHVSVAAVVQKMVQSEVSGIAFTVHPVTEDYDRMIIEAGYGLGEAIVGGMITPDSYVIKKDGLEIEDKYISSQDMMISRSPEGTSEQEVQFEKQELQKLPDQEIKELAQICLNIEKHYGFPCDIEWAFEAGKLYITQSRPITTLSRTKNSDSGSGNHFFKKMETRALSLAIMRCWYLSDRHGFHKLTDGLMFFEPLFIHEDGRGVSVYYDFTDPQQDPKLLFPYFLENKEKFSQLVNDYENDCEEILRLIVLDRAEDFKKVFELLARSWTMLAISTVLGGMEVEEKYSGIARTSYETRLKYDTVVYKAEEYFLKVIKSSFFDGDDTLAGYVLPEEFIEGKVPAIAELKQRQEKYVYFRGNLETDYDMQAFCRENGIDLENADLAEHGKEIIGTVANPGRVSGRVALVFEKAHLAKVQKGDILITPMTTPDFLPAMRLASAFVTDEGGITCHAAIVARELKKPCVIGTRIATSVLKDGDLVEVDADNGMVTILK